MKKEDDSVKGIFVLADADQGLDEAVKFNGDELIILIPLDKSRVASGFERHVKRLRERAKEVKNMLAARGIRSKLLVEWGDRDEVVRNASLREYAKVLNNPD